MVVGYIGVIFTHSRMWQGVFIDDMARAASDAYLHVMRNEPGVGSVPEPVPPGGPMPPFKGFVANLAAGFCRGVSGGAPVSPLGLAGMAYALHHLTGLRYFILTSRNEPQGGVTTLLENLPNARSVEDARAAFGRHPDIVAFKRAVWADLRGRMHGTPGRA